MNKPHFDFRGNYEKYLPGVPPIPYFDQSVAYVELASETSIELASVETASELSV